MRFWWRHLKVSISREVQKSCAAVSIKFPWISKNRKIYRWVLWWHWNWIGNIDGYIKEKKNGNGNGNHTIAPILSLIKQNDRKLLSVKLPGIVYVVYDSGPPYLSRPSPARLDREISGTSPPTRGCASFYVLYVLFNLIDCRQLGWAGLEWEGVLSANLMLLKGSCKTVIEFDLVKKKNCQLASEEFWL